MRMLRRRPRSTTVAQPQLDDGNSVKHSMQEWLRREVARAELAEGGKRAMHSLELNKQRPRRDRYNSVCHSVQEWLKLEVMKAETADATAPTLQEWLQLEVAKAEMADADPGDAGSHATLPTLSGKAERRWCEDYARCLPKERSAPNASASPLVQSKLMPRIDEPEPSTMCELAPSADELLAPCSDELAPCSDSMGILTTRTSNPSPTKTSPISRSPPHDRDRIAHDGTHAWLRGQIMWAEITERSWSTGRFLGSLPDGWPPGCAPASPAAAS